MKYNYNLCKRRVTSLSTSENDIDYRNYKQQENDIFYPAKSSIDVDVIEDDVVSNNEGMHEDEIDISYDDQKTEVNSEDEEEENVFEFNVTDYSRQIKPKECLEFNLSSLPQIERIDVTFPKDFTPGPKLSPNDKAEWREGDKVLKFFETILKHQLQTTNECAVKNKKGYSNSRSVFQIDKTDLLNYKVCFWIMGLVHFLRKR